MAANSPILMAAIIAVLFFIATPGVMWTFPEPNLTDINDPTKINKMNAVFAAALFGIVLTFIYPNCSGNFNKI